MGLAGRVIPAPQVLNGMKKGALVALLSEVWLLSQRYRMESFPIRPERAMVGEGQIAMLPQLTTHKLISPRNAGCVTTWLNEKHDIRSILHQVPGILPTAFDRAAEDQFATAMAAPCDPMIVEDYGALLQKMIASDGEF
jgi:hypothetical protein